MDRDINSTPVPTISNFPPQPKKQYSARSIADARKRRDFVSPREAVAMHPELDWTSSAQQGDGYAWDIPSAQLPHEDQEYEPPKRRLAARLKRTVTNMGPPAAPTPRTVQSSPPTNRPSNVQTHLQRSPKTPAMQTDLPTLPGFMTSSPLQAFNNHDRSGTGQSPTQRSRDINSETVQGFRTQSPNSQGHNHPSTSHIISDLLNGRLELITNNESPAQGTATGPVIRPSANASSNARSASSENEESPLPASHGLPKGRPLLKRKADMTMPSFQHNPRAPSPIPRSQRSIPHLEHSEPAQNSVEHRPSRSQRRALPQSSNEQPQFSLTPADEKLFEIGQENTERDWVNWAADLIQERVQDIIRQLDDDEDVPNVASSANQSAGALTQRSNPTGKSREVTANEFLASLTQGHGALGDRVMKDELTSVALRGRGPDELRGDVQAVLLTADDEILEACIRGNVSARVENDPDFRRKINTMYRYCCASRAPMIYCQELVDQDGNPPLVSDMEMALDAIKQYCFGDQTDEEVISFAWRCDNWKGEEEERPTLQQSAHGMRKYIDTKDCQPSDARVRAVRSMVKHHRAAAKDTAAKGHRRLLVSTSNMGFTGDALQRFAKHVLHKESNYLLNLLECVMHQLFPGKYEIKMHCVYVAAHWRLCHVAEIIFMRLRQSFLASGSGATHYPGGISCTAVRSEQKWRQYWEYVKKTSNFDEKHRKEIERLRMDSQGASTRYADTGPRSFGGATSSLVRGSGDGAYR